MIKILITRPLKQSQELAAILNSMNISTIIFPTIEIINSDPIKSLTNIDTLKTADIVIFTSQNAVEKAAINKLFKIIDHADYVAVGPTTAKKLIELNVQVDAVATTPYTSESLLALPYFNNVKNKKIIIITGKNSRILLKTTLEQRGAEVSELIVYQRVAPTKVPIEVEQNWESIELIICNSFESLRNLFRFFKTQPERILSKTLIVPSSRIAMAGKKLGFQKVLVAENATNEAMQKCLLKYISDLAVK